MGICQAQPMSRPEGMSIGLSQYRDPTRLTLPWLLIQPFLGPAPYPLGQRKEG